jgi:hypothetical protein
MLTDARINAILDTEIAVGDKLSLHTAYSTTGASEVTGGSYARVTATWSAAISRQKAMAAAVDFTGLAAGAVVAFVGLWNSAGTVFRGMTANGGSEFSFQVGVTPDTILAEGHGLANNDRVVFTGAPPTGLTEGTIYFVVGVVAGDPDTFQVSLTQGGTVVGITGQAAANCMASKCVLETYAGAGGTHRINTFVTKM